jgi:hypothetical membrane protein
MRRATLHLGWIAGALFAVAVLIAAHGIEGFEHAHHPVGLLGSSLAPRAGLFNALGFVVPGLLVAAFAVAFELELGAGEGARALRIGTGLLLVAALALELDGPATRRHALAQAISQLAWIAAAASIAIGFARAPRWRITAACGLLFAGVLLWDLVRPFAGQRGWIERGVFLLWFGWPAVLAWRALGLHARDAGTGATHRLVRPGDA